MKKIIEIKSNKINNFYKHIKYLNLIRFFKYSFSIRYCGKIYCKKTSKTPPELDIVLNFIDILNSKSRREKYELIYDYSCEYLDNEFIRKKICNFENDTCIRNRCRTKGIKVSSCCENSKNHFVCDKFDNVNKCCSIKSLGCKLYTCYFLRKKGIRYRVNDVPYLKYFLSIRQKAICINSIFKDKDEIVDKFMTFYRLP